MSAVDLIGQLSNPEWPGHSVATSRNRADGGGETTPGRHRVRQKQTRLSPPRVEELVETRSTGATIAELAERFDIHRTTVMAHLRRQAGRAAS